MISVSSVLQHSRINRCIRCILMCVSFVMTAEAVAADPEKVVLLVREQRSENGDIIPLPENVRNVLAYFEHQLHIQFDIRRYPMPRVLANVKNGEGLVFGISKNTERQALFTFSEPVYANSVWVVKRSDDNFTFDTIYDFKGKTIGIARGTSYGDEFDKQSKVLFKVENDINSNASRLKKLISKRTDLMLVSTSFTQAADVETRLHQQLSNEEINDDQVMQAGFTVLKKPLMKDELYFASAPGDGEQWINKLNRAIIAGKKSGEISRLINAAVK